MKLLVTNDDGIDAPGIEALEQLCRSWGDVVVVAPDRPQSGVGHAVTTHDALELHEVGRGRHALTGTPADCVRVGLHELLPDADWVVAGINAGGNLGADAYTSGTLAAAREGAFLGKPALAISQYVARAKPIAWNATARRAAAVLERVFAQQPLAHTYWNANLPHPASDAAPVEVVEAPLDPSPMLVRYRRVDGAIHWDGDYHERPRERGSDVDVCFSGNVALTRISLRWGG